MTAAVLEVDKCASPDCGQEDNHPKFHLMAPTYGGPGWETYHHDCAHQLGHTKASIILHHVGDAKGDELRGLLTDKAHPVHDAVKQHTLREAASIHVKSSKELIAMGLNAKVPNSDELLQWLGVTDPSQDLVDHVFNLVGAQMMASCFTQTEALNYLAAELGSGSYTARTGAIVLRLIATQGSQASAGTAVTGGSYSDQTCAFGTPSSLTGSFAGQTANTGTPTYTNMPATTVNGVELLDSAGTPVRKDWGPLTASKTTNSGDTVSVAAGAIAKSV